MKNNKFILAIATAILTTTTYAEVEITGKITYEGSVFTSGGTTIGADNKHKGGDVLKSEVGARFYVDGEVGEESTWHAEIQGIVGGEDNDSYTQNEVLREAYIDTTIKDWSVRAGKQQVVWGTADGIKLLDMINPTDYAEMAQNQMEDSRIPVWMINAEKDFENGGNLQVILSQPRENIFAGLNRGIDTQARANATTPNAQGVFVDLTTKNGHNSNHAFMMKGVDSITGETNGFLNITPDLGSVARAFANGFGAINSLAGAGMENFTVDIFESLNMAQMATQLGGALPVNFQTAVNQVATALGKASTAVTGEEMLAYGFAPAYDTNLVNYTTSSKDSAFDYMGATTFKTFDAFVNAKSQYVYNMPDDTDLDIAFRFKNSTENGLNYSINTS
jgi:hypothetical protein